MKEYLSLSRSIYDNPTFFDELPFWSAPFGIELLHHRFIQGAFLPSWVELLPYASVDAVFDLVERNLNHTARRNGGLTLTIPFVVIDAVKE